MRSGRILGAWAMGSDLWPVMSLREAGVELLDCEHRTPPAADLGYPYIAIPQVKNGHLDLGSARRVSREHFLEWTRKAKPQQNDVVLSRRCNPGETAVVPSDLECVLGQNLVLLRADGTRISPAFLRWLVRSPDWWEQVSAFINAGAVFDSLKCADIPGFRLPIPPKSEQLRIAAVLDALDDKIELNRRMNGTLESIAHAVFQSWFIDVDPVCIKALASEADLSGDGSIAQLADLVVVHRDSVAPGEIENEIVDHYSIPAFDDGRMPAAEFGSTIKSNKFAVQTGSVLVSRLNPRIPRVWLPTLRGSRRGVCSTEFMVLSPRPPFTREYLYGLLRTDEFREELSSRITGTSGSHQRVKPLDVMSIPVVSPPRRHIAAFSRLAAPLLEQVGLLREETRMLADLRDALLPRLLDGSLSPSCSNLEEGCTCPNS